MKETMGDGEIELSDHVVLQNSDSSSNTPAVMPIDLFLDELLKSSTTCTHTHTCNPPGPDAAHTHTCYHTHMHIFPSAEGDGEEERLVSKPKGASSGNREAVRKYREKKKAQTAYLEEEVKKLRFLNQQLIRKVQGQAVLEAEVLRLRGLLLDLRGKIDSELGGFPSQKQCFSNTSFKQANCQSGNENVSCFHSPANASSLHPSSVNGGGKSLVSQEANCRVNANDMGTGDGCALDLEETLVSSASQAD